MNVYYILENDEQKGPYTINQLRSMWASGSINLQTLFCQEGYTHWIALQQLVPLLETGYSQVQSQPRVQTIERTKKSIKSVMALCSLGLLVSFLVACYGEGGWKALGLFGLVFSFLGLMIARISRWWCHD